MNNRMHQLVVDNYGIAINDYSNFDATKMDGLRKDIRNFVSKEEVSYLSDVFNAMVEKGYWTGAIQEMLLHMIDHKHIHQFVYGGTHGDVNQVIAFDAPMHVHHLMNRKVKEWKVERNVEVA